MPDKDYGRFLRESAKCSCDEALVSMTVDDNTTRINGLYANYCKIGHNAFEFVLDFGQWQKDSGKESIHTRIITAPAYAKAFLEILKESITEYEKEFGTIRHEGDE